MYQYKCECGYCKPSHSSAFSTLNQPCSHVKRNRLDGVVRGRDLKGCDNHKHLFLRKLACNLLQRTNAHNTPQQWTADEKKSVQPGVEKKNREGETQVWVVAQRAKPEAGSSSDCIVNGMQVPMELGAA